MRIGVDAREWVSGRQTGIGRYLETLLGRAGETRPEWRWVLYLHAGYERRLQTENIEYVQLPQGPAPLVDQIHLPGALRADPPDLFFSPYQKGPWRTPCPLIVVVHDMRPVVLPRRWGGLRGFRRRWYLWYTRRSTRKASRVVTVSRASAEDMKRYLRIPEEKIAVIHESADRGIAEGGLDRAVLTDLGLKGPYLLAVGHLRPHKNQEVLVRAWAGVERYPGDARLVLVGSGPDRARLQALADELSAADRIVWLERADNQTLSTLYRESSALLQPSIIEGFGLPVLEAMASGTPAVV